MGINSERNPANLDFPPRTYGRHPSSVAPPEGKAESEMDNFVYRIYCLLCFNELSCRRQ